MTERRVTKGKIKVFSNTTEPGVVGQLKRAAEWRHRRPIELAGAVTRRFLRADNPFKLLSFPQAVHIEITNRCNLACVMCPHPTMERTQGQMSEELFRKIVAELAEHKLMLENVAVMGLGEPMLHTQFEDFVAIAARAGVPNLYVSTNGTAINDRRARRLVEESGLDRVIISLDGATKETYEAVRIGGKFEAVMENATRLLRVKRELGRRRPVVTLQILTMPQTRGEIDEFCRRWEPELGEGDEILIKEVDTFGGLVDDIRIDAEREPPKRIPCRMLWKDISISWDGKITVCCKDVYYQLAVGDANTTSLREAWNAPKWNAFRKLHEKGEWDRIHPCDVCREWYV